VGEQLPGGNALVGWSPDLGTPTTFVLIRHGESPLTAEKRFSGSGGSDPGLTDEGRWQAAVAAEELTDAGRFAALGRHTPFTRVDHVITSPLLRTRETAQVVADRLGVDVTVEDEVRECAFGQWDGLTYGEVDAGWSDHLGRWIASPSVQPPGGESFDEVYARVSAARARLADEYRGSTVAVVSHVTPIKSFVRDVVGAPSSAMFRMELAPASITVVQWFADGIGSLRMFNHTAHLATPR
jgi:broad specificity phosphatase PhoE